MSEEKQNSQNDSGGGKTGKIKKDQKALESAVFALRQYRDTAEDKRQRLSTKRDRAIAALPEQDYQEFINKINDARKFGGNTISYKDAENIPIQDLDLTRLNYWRQQSKDGAKNESTLKEDLLGQGLDPMMQDLKTMAGLKSVETKRVKPTIDKGNKDIARSSKLVELSSIEARPSKIDETKDLEQGESKGKGTAQSSKLEPRPTIDDDNLEINDIDNDGDKRAELRKSFKLMDDTGAAEVDKGWDLQDVAGRTSNIELRTTIEGKDAASGARNTNIAPVIAAGGMMNGVAVSPALSDTKSSSVQGPRQSQQNLQATAKVETKATVTPGVQQAGPMSQAAPQNNRQAFADIKIESGKGKERAQQRQKFEVGPSKKPLNRTMTLRGNPTANKDTQVITERTAANPMGGINNIDELSGIDAGWGNGADLAGQPLEARPDSQQKRNIGIQSRTPTLRGIPRKDTGRSAKSRAIGPQSILPPIDAAMRLGEMQQQSRTSAVRHDSGRSGMGGDTQLADTYSQALSTHGGLDQSQAVSGSFVYDPMATQSISKQATAPGSMSAADDTAIEAGGGYMPSSDEDRARVLAQQQQGARLKQSMTPVPLLTADGEQNPEYSLSQNGLDTATRPVPESDASPTEAPDDETEGLMQLASQQTRARSLAEKAQSAKESIEGIKNTAKGAKKFMDLVKTGELATSFSGLTLLLLVIQLNLETLRDIFKKTQGQDWGSREYIMFGLTVFTDFGMIFFAFINLMVWLWPFVLVLVAVLAIVVVALSGVTMPEFTEILNVFK